MRNNKKYADREKLIADFKSSNLSMKEWSMNNNIPCSTLAGWLKRSSNKSCNAKPVRFVEVPVPVNDAEIASTSITIEYKDFKISISDKLNPDIFRKMLKVVMEIYV